MSEIEIAFKNPRIRRVVIQHLEFLADSLRTVSHERFSGERGEILTAIQALRKIGMPGLLEPLPSIKPTAEPCRFVDSPEILRYSRAYLASQLVQLSDRYTDARLLSGLPKPKLLDMFIKVRDEGRKKRP